MMDTFLFAVLAIFVQVTTLTSFSLRPMDRNVLKSGASCPAEIFSCPKPLSYRQTQEFMCRSDADCPNEYKCCTDSCFEHFVCKKSEAEAFCPIDKMRCAAPLNPLYTRQFLCNSKSQCPSDYACCSDSCFQHKICKLSKVNIENKGILPFIYSTTTGKSTTAATEQSATTTAEASATTTTEESATTTTGESPTSTLNGKVDEEENIIQERLINLRENATEVMTTSEVESRTMAATTEEEGADQTTTESNNDYKNGDYEEENNGNDYSEYDDENNNESS